MLYFINFSYQLFLQVKQDVLQGRLPISFELAAELGAYIIQCKYLNEQSTNEQTERKWKHYACVRVCNTINLNEEIKLFTEQHVENYY